MTAEERYAPRYYRIGEFCMEKSCVDIIVTMRISIDQLKTTSRIDSFIPFGDSSFTIRGLRFLFTTLFVALAATVAYTQYT